MIFFNAIILGLVQGITEFLPVSSTGHIFLVESMLGLVPDIDLALWLHIGSLVAVMGYFWRDLWNMMIGLVRMVQEKKENEYGVYAAKLLVATVATGCTALIIREWFPYSELSLSLVGFTLLITAGLIYIAEKHPRTHRPLSWTIVIILGIVQGIAILPGISRAGITIAVLIWLGVSRRLAARTSFLLSIPTIIGAAVFTYLEQGDRFLSLGLFEIIAVATSVVSAYCAIVLMMRWVEGKWIYFAYYCAILGIGILGWTLIVL